MTRDSEVTITKTIHMRPKEGRDLEVTHCADGTIILKQGRDTIVILASMCGHLMQALQR